MPRVGNEFVAPFPPVISDTTIESEVHNGIVADFVADANNPRPVTAGGTGASNPQGARVNLQAERSMQVVTNYASHVFETGSFQSAAEATDSPPSGNAPHVGGALVLDANNIILYAWNVSGTDPSEAYFWQREKIAGVWLPWYSLSINQAFKVDKAGGTMTGFLTLHANPVNPLHAAPKQYVDSADAAANTNANSRVAKVGDIMTGQLVLPATASITDPAHGLYAARRDYVDSVSAATGMVMKNPPPLTIQTITGPLNMAGGVTENFIRVPTLVDTDPSNWEHCVNKTYLMGHVTRLTDTIDALRSRIEELERKLK